MSIVDSGKYYLYRHIRLDKNEPFYIGIGTKRPIHDGVYNRAITKTVRNDIWGKIASKTKYIVEILLESNNYDFILQKEIEFIKLYGRINLRTGILSNLTDGGAGSFGRPVLEKTRQKIRERLKGKIRGKEGQTKKQNLEYRKSQSERTRKQMSMPGAKEGLFNQKRCIPVLQYTKEGDFIKEWPSIGRAASFYSLFDSVIVKVCKGKAKTSGGYFWKYKNKQIAK